MDDQIEMMYAKVAVPFLKIAEERGETLSQETIKKIVVKFMLMAHTMGMDAVNEHLTYELDKYWLEGLRPDYR